MTDYDYLLPSAKKLIKGLAGKPGIKITDTQMTADYLAQALHKMLQRNEVRTKKEQEQVDALNKIRGHILDQNDKPYVCVSKALLVCTDALRAAGEEIH